jgi:hypothetical protein
VTGILGFFAALAQLVSCAKCCPTAGHGAAGLAFRRPTCLPRSDRGTARTAAPSARSWFSETVFLHETTRSLIVTDIVHNYDGLRPSGLLASLLWPVFALIGFRGTCLAPLLRIPGIRRDRSAFAAALRVINAWNVSRVVVCHGAVLETDASNVLTALSTRYLGS